MKKVIIFNAVQEILTKYIIGINIIKTNKEKLQKEARARYQNLSEEENN